MKEEYAFITGSSSGIGESFAKQLASENYNIILHGRNELNLKRIQREIIEKYKVKCEYIILDLSSTITISQLDNLLSSFNITTFISNAGLGVAGYFNETSLDDELKVSNLHVNSIIVLTKYFITKFKVAKEGRILNISSLYAFFPVPKQSIYAATKTFQHSFFLSIHKEMKMQFPLIKISSVCPGLTYSNFRIRQGKQEKSSIVGMSSLQVCKIALKGLDKNQAEILPGFFAKMMSIVIPLLPRSFALSIIYQMNKQRGF